MNRDGPAPSAMALETERLSLRPWRIADAAFQRQLWLERDPRVPAHRRISPDGHPTVAELEERLRHQVQEPAPGLLVVELKRSGEAVGYCGLIAGSAGQYDEPELAFEFLQKFWNFGYATEASRAIVAHARATGHRSLGSTVRTWNGASLRVLEKLGFTTTGDVEADRVHGDSLLLRLAL